MQFNTQPATHRDGEKLDWLIATPVVVLPSSFWGGELVVRHEGRKRVIDFCGANRNLFYTHFAAFAAGCEHEVRPLMVDVFVSILTAEPWRDANGDNLPFGQMEVEPTEIVPLNALTKVQPEEDIEGSTGNEGLPPTCWYRRAAVFLRPAAHHFEAQVHGVQVVVVQTTETALGFAVRRSFIPESVAFRWSSSMNKPIRDRR